MVRIAFLGQSGPYSPVALRHLVTHSPGFSLALVVEGMRERPGADAHHLLAPRRGRLPGGDDLAALASAAGVPVLRTRNVNDARAVAVLREHALDLLVCVGFDRLFSPAVLQSAAGGGINAHPSLLPAWRGPSPIFWAVRQGERELGVTLHQLDAHEDHGPIYAAQRFVRPPRASGEALFALAAELAGPLLVQVLLAAKEGALRGMEQEHTRATRAPRPQPHDRVIEPGAWSCEQALDFACAAAYFGGAEVRLGEGDQGGVRLRRGLRAELGARLDPPKQRAGEEVGVQCRDGAAYFEVDSSTNM